MKTETAFGALALIIGGVIGFVPGLLVGEAVTLEKQKPAVEPVTIRPIENMLGPGDATLSVIDSQNDELCRITVEGKISGKTPWLCARAAADPKNVNIEADWVTTQGETILGFMNCGDGVYRHSYTFDGQWGKVMHNTRCP